MSEGALAATLAVREAGPTDAPKPRLLDRVREAVRARHYSRSTEKTYVHWIKSAFLTSPAVHDKVAASNQNQALSALLFLYREVLGVELPWLDGGPLRRRSRQSARVIHREGGRDERQRRQVHDPGPRDVRRLSDRPGRQGEGARDLADGFLVSVPDIFWRQLPGPTADMSVPRKDGYNAAVAKESRDRVLRCFTSM